MRVTASPPQSEESIRGSELERAMIGVLLSFPELLDDIEISTSDFGAELNRIILEAIFSLHRGASVPVDWSTVAVEVSRLGFGDYVGAENLRDMANSAHSPEAAPAFLAELRVCASRRRIAELGKTLVDLSSSLPIDDLVARAERMLADVRTPTTTAATYSYAELANMAYESTERQRQTNGGTTDGSEWLPCSIWELRDVLRYERKTMAVLGGRPGTGKSTLGFQLAEDIASQGFTFAIASQEMHELQVGRRALARRTRIAVNTMKDGGVINLNLLRRAADEAGRLPIEVDCRPGRTLTDLRTWIRKLKREAAAGKRPKVFGLLLDYAQISKFGSGGREEARHEALGRFITGMADMAKEEDIYAIVLSQLNRGAEARADKRPEAGDLAAADAINCAAAWIGLTHRDPADPKWRERCDLIVAKSRDGVTDSRELKFDGPSYTFGETR